MPLFLKACVVDCKVGTKLMVRESRPRQSEAASLTSSIFLLLQVRGPDYLRDKRPWEGSVLRARWCPLFFVPNYKPEDGHPSLLKLS